MSGGVEPFTYNISGPQNNTNTSGNFTNLSPGNYNYTVNTGGGCDVTGTFTINPGPPLPVTVNSTPLSCNGAADGTATRSEEHTSELQSRPHLVCRLLLEKK